MNDFMSALTKATEALQPNVSVTENGAVGYKTTGKALLDLNFMLSSMRNMEPNEIWQRFLPAYNEDPVLAVIWLFFARDIRGCGCGERRTFRIIFDRLCRENDKVAIKLLKLIPFYGRWDDLLEIVCCDAPCNVRDAAFNIFKAQLDLDMNCANFGKPVSILAKWVYSSVTSSKETIRKAERLRCMLGWTPKQYRQNFAKLRKHIDVTEQRMSAQEWDKINYPSVPSRAAMNYREAFMRHDEERYSKYLDDVKSGSSKINAGTLYPYDIVHAYGNMSWHHPAIDDTLEAQWKALPNTVPEGGSTLVVVDGSGSMGCTVGNSGVTCHDVANSLGIYFSEKLSGPFKDTFITFSSRPQLIHFDPSLSLNGKLDILYQHDDCSNTDIEKVFDLILTTAASNHLKQEEIPANILIVSDGEFDAMTYRGGYYYGYKEDTAHVDQKLFEAIRERWDDSGYKLPRLIFWNVCSRTGTIPVTTNELGVALVSGFSPNIADMVMSGELDPYKCLVDKLMSDRYEPVRQALKE